MPLFLAERRHWVGVHRASCRETAGDERHAQHERDSSGIHPRIERRHFEEQRAERSGRQGGDERADCDACDCHAETVANDQEENARRPRAQSQTQADLG